MDLKKKVIGLFRRFGSPIRFATKQVLNVVLPGSPAVIDLVGQVLDCVHETAKDQHEFDESKLPPATAGDLKRIEEILDVVSDDLQTLVAQVVSLERMPEAAAKIVQVALVNDERCRRALQKFDNLARRFDRLEEQNRKLLAGQSTLEDKIDEILELLRMCASAVPFIAELRTAGVTPDVFCSLLEAFRKGANSLGTGKTDRARHTFLGLAKVRPQSSAVAVVLAGAQAVDRDLAAAEQSLARASRLSPQNEAILNLYQQLIRRCAELPLTPANSNASKKSVQDPVLENKKMTILSSVCCDGAGSRGEPLNGFALVKLVPGGRLGKPLDLNLALVLDVSGSMHEEDGTGASRFKRVQDACVKSLDYLKKTDHLSIVVFAGSALRVCSKSLMQPVLGDVP